MRKKRIIYFIGILVFWTLLLTTLVIIEFHKSTAEMNENARIEARANFNKDQAIRHWAASHGGVYVPIDSVTPPNPALSHVPERDIETPSGKKLTLMNPAYMIRQMNERFGEEYGIVGHITSEKPIRKENKPDDWELKALKSFQEGVKEVSEFTEIDDEPYLRLMQPMFIEQSCLKCHGHQGYKVGEVRGGLGIAIPMKLLHERGHTYKKRAMSLFLIIWAFGLAALSLAFWRIMISLQKQELAERNLKIQNQQLIIAKEKAEESERLKSAFLTNMSHEIRTPMNGILGFSDLLKDPQLSGDLQQEYVEIIMKSGKRMLNTINDIIDISRIESGQMEVSIDEVNINEQIDYVYKFFKPEADKKGIELFYKKGLPDKESIVNTDCKKVASILTNLVKNAIRYSSEGTVEFGYIFKKSIDYEKNETLELEFYVKDRGIGIPKARQEAIFERFFRVDTDDDSVYEGSGLGLAISKAYLDMLGGSICVKSEEGVGSQFNFTIPYVVSNLKEEEQVSVEDMDSQKKRLKILVAEDDETSRLLLSIMLKDICREVLYAKTGTEAVDACRSNPDIDLILMDIQMPQMNGYIATEKIREFNKEVIIFAQTAYAFLDDYDKAIEIGCNEHISKPIGGSELLFLINKYFG